MCGEAVCVCLCLREERWPGLCVRTVCGNDAGGTDAACAVCTSGHCFAAQTCGAQAQAKVVGVVVVGWQKEDDERRRRIARRVCVRRTYNARA